MGGYKGKELGKETEFGKKLKVLRRENRLTQAQLGEKVGISGSYITMIEKGKRRSIKREKVEALAKALGLDDEEKDEFLILAGYVPTSLIYYSPSDSKKISSVKKKDEEREKALNLENPTLKLIADVLNDPEISAENKKDMEKQIITFVEWLRDKSKK